MLYRKNGLKFYFYEMCVSFCDVNDMNKIKETYVHALEDINHFIRQTHIIDVKSYKVLPTEEQYSRLELLNSFDTLGTVTHFAGTEFVKNGIIVPNSPMMELPDSYHMTSLMNIKYKIASKIREMRKIKEAEGVTVDNNGTELFVRTDTDTQAKLASANLILADTDTYHIETFDWELFPFTWDVVDKAKIQFLSKIVFQHVQSCFTLSKNEQSVVFACDRISELLNLDLAWFDVKQEYPLNLFVEESYYDYDDSVYDMNDSSHDIDDSSHDMNDSSHDMNDSSHDIDDMNVDEFDSN